MPSLTSDNNVQILISTQANLAGIEETKAGMAELDGQTAAAASSSVNWGGEFQKAGLVAAGALTGLTLAGKDMLSSFNASQQVTAQLDAVLKSTGGSAGITRDAAIALSKSIEHNTALSDEAVLTGENMLLTFNKVGKDAFPDATKAVADWATAMNGGAIPNAQQMKDTALQLGIALQDPDKGLGRLHRVGVDTDELSQKFTANMSIQDKQKLILQELSKEFGGSAAASLNTYAGQMAHTKEKLDDVKESFGQTISKALEPFRGVLEKAIPYLQQFANFLANNKTAVILIAGAIAGLLVVAIAAAVIAIGWIPLAIAAAGAVIGAVVAVIISHWKEWKGWIEVIAAIIGAPLIPFIAMVVLFIKYFGDIKSFALSVTNDIIGFFIGAWNVIKGVWSAVTGFFAGVWNGIKSGVGAIGGALSGPFKAEFNLIARIWNDTVGKLHFSAPSWVPGIGGKGFSMPTLPYFAQGVQNFSGGWAVVGENGPEVAYLPKGSNVYANNGMGNSNVTNNKRDVTIGTIVLGSAAAAQEFFNQIDRDNLLVSKGLTAARGMS